MVYLWKTIRQLPVKLQDKDRGRDDNAEGDYAQRVIQQSSQSSKVPNDNRNQCNE